MASQTKKRIQVMTVRPVIRPPQKTTERMGNSGTHGTLKPLGRSGCVLRSTSTPMETSTKANKVPMFDRSAASPISTRPLGRPTARPAIQVLQCGVL